MRHFNRVIFVDRGNTCRSIMAEAILRQVRDAMQVSDWNSIISRGLAVLFPEPLNPKAVAIIKGHGLNVDRTNSVLFTEEECGESTLVLTMTEREKRQILEDYTAVPNLYTLREFAGERGDIEEPYGKSLAEYGALYEYLDLMVKMAVQKLLKEDE